MMQSLTGGRAAPNPHLPPLPSDPANPTDPDMKPMLEDLQRLAAPEGQGPTRFAREALRELLGQGMPSP